MIELQKVTHVFNRGQVNEVIALREVDLRIEAGEFIVLIGSNGSGKTTLLNLIAGSILPTAGSVILNGVDATSLPEYRRSKWIARVFQDPLGGTAPELSILDNFRLAALRTQSKKLTIGINAVFKRHVRERIATLEMGLEDKIYQPMGTLSGGQRQALTLLMSVMDDTQILLLDEPTAALDPKTAETIMHTAQHLIETYQLTTLFITHNMTDTLRYGKRLIQMDAGKIAYDLKNEEKAALSIEDLYDWF